MWLATRYGFYSIACAQREDGSLDPDTLMVRARLRVHLESLQKRLPALTVFPILSTPERDYPYRIILPKTFWAVSLSGLALEQEWSNFKHETQVFQGEAGAEYVGALPDVWARMARLSRTQR